MSASKGMSGAGSRGGRSPRTDNADVVERHASGGRTPSTGTDASTAARRGARGTVRSAGGSKRGGSGRTTRGSTKKSR